MKALNSAINNLRPCNKGFTMIEIMVVVAIISIVIAIAHQTWLRQREFARARACQENLAKIDGAKEQYALDHKLGDGEPVGSGALEDLTSGDAPYLRHGPTCSAGGSYTVNVIGQNPACSYEGREWAPQHVLQ
ncbi:prepilin-type N-terminal cleavage/methylation domain-containing protein [Candidatus Sumerlaeota bacterium]|nr:prepilin-type N-terminal cleavage/methylation domain-containing protein [Candidatus Sumerlaeota bacterium]